ncbi:Ras family GTPase RAS1 [Entamoeba marina]
MQQRIIKLVLFGVGSVGRSSIVIREIQNYFINEYDPTIEDYYRKILEIDGEQVAIEILDTSEFEGDCPSMIQWRREGEGFVIVYSITDRDSFCYVSAIHKRILEMKYIKDNTYLPIILVGNKIDLEEERKVTTEEGEQLADSLGIDFIECSAKEGININEIFEIITSNVINNSPRKLNQSKERKRGCMLS